MPEETFQRRFAVGFVGRDIAGCLHHHMLVELMQVTIKTVDGIPLSREYIGQLVGESIDVGKKTDPPAFEIDTVQQVVADHFDRLLEGIEDKAMGVEAFLTKPIQHGRTDVEGHMATLENAARTTRVVALLDHSDGKLPLGQKTGCRQTR